MGEDDLRGEVAHELVPGEGAPPHPRQGPLEPGDPRRKDRLHLGQGPLGPGVEVGPEAFRAKAGTAAFKTS